MTVVAEFRRDNTVKRSEAKEKGQAKKRKSGGGNSENGEAERATPPDLNSSPPVPSGEEEKVEDVEDMQVS